MTKVNWKTGRGNEIEVTFTAEAHMFNEAVKADGQETGIVKSHLMENMTSNVTMDGVSLGSVRFDAVTKHPVIVVALNGKIGLTKERYEEIKAAEKAEAASVLETEEIKSYLENKAAVEAKAAEEMRIYDAHSAVMKKAMEE